jgi:hypothetical protein
MEIEVGPGWFFPYGDWSRDFSRGKMFEVQVYFPLTRALMLGGGFATASISGSTGQGEVDFILPEVLLRYRIKNLRERIIPHVGFRAGFSREELKVGSGRETDFDVFTSAAGGISWEINDRASLQVEASHVWFLAPSGGRGFTLIPSFRFTI